MEKRRNPRLVAAIALVVLAASGGGPAKQASPACTAVPRPGLPAWFGCFIGRCEALGCVVLLIRLLGALAAAGIGIIMIGATYCRATYTPIVQAAPAFVLLLSCAYVFHERRGDMVGA